MTQDIRKLVRIGRILSARAEALEDEGQYQDAIRMRNRASRYFARAAEKLLDQVPDRARAILAEWRAEGLPEDEGWDMTEAQWEALDQLLAEVPYEVRAEALREVFGGKPVEI